MVVNKKLGKGLSSLLGNKDIVPNKGSENKGLLLIPIEKIYRDETQPRKEFDEKRINELAQSIKNNGLIQPLIVKKKNQKIIIWLLVKEDGELLRKLISKFFLLYYCPRTLIKMKFPHRYSKT